jgi:hypothetical protein
MQESPHRLSLRPAADTALWGISVADALDQRIELDEMTTSLYQLPCP